MSTGVPYLYLYDPIAYHYHYSGEHGLSSVCPAVTQIPANVLPSLLDAVDLFYEQKVIHTFYHIALATIPSTSMIQFDTDEELKQLRCWLEQNEPVWTKAVPSHDDEPRLGRKVSKLLKGFTDHYLLFTEPPEYQNNQLIGGTQFFLTFDMELGVKMYLLSETPVIGALLTIDSGPFCRDQVAEWSSIAKTLLDGLVVAG